MPEGRRLLRAARGAVACLRPAASCSRYTVGWYKKYMNTKRGRRRLPVSLPSADFFRAAFLFVQFSWHHLYLIISFKQSLLPNIKFCLWPVTKRRKSIAYQQSTSFGVTLGGGGPLSAALSRAHCCKKEKPAKREMRTAGV